MRVSDNEAAQRMADNDNLVGELVIHLQTTTNMLQSTCLVVADPEARCLLLEAVRDARALIAKAKGDQQ
ncbi:hypothetical protein RSP822_18060 [Ralstonia solanacearum]|uniref:hypothetical protein n=1 Tax=Ralstonia solanacearum TaxID=305 RepID=UPI000E6645FD|nr:hypothetical protein [Ralstonia solanacearum]RIJ84975.1 hypothetical protein RSP822_18060 [Ralstonia solanacearum]